MQETIDAAIRSVPGAQRGVLFMWNDDDKQLVIEAVAREEFFEDKNIRNVIKLGSGDGYAGKVFATGEPLSIGNVGVHPSVYFRDHPDIIKQKSVLSVPLKVWGRIIGVLSVDNISALNAFRDSDITLLSTFAAQAAIALQNAQLHTELKKLGLTINNNTLTIPEIFIETVQSIQRITGAKGAHMLLLRDVNADLADNVELSKSVGLEEDYDSRIKPRSDGLTFQVLRDRRYHAVSNPDESPGINPFTAERGVKAYICLPMEVSTNLIGVLFVYYAEKHEFTKDETDMLSLFCNQAALAIENTRQREKLEIMENVTWMGIQFSEVAHSMGTQLDAITMRVNILREQIDNPTALSDIDKLTHYLENAYGILKRAPLPFHPTPIDVPLNSTLRQVIPAWCTEEQNIDLSFDALNDDEITVNADKALLAIVLKILTTNAVTAMREVHQKRLLVSSAIRRGRGVVTITNTGREIPREIQDRLTKQPIAKTPGTSGTGVGLLIAKSILLRSDGDLEFKSQADETTFSFFLPLSKAHGQTNSVERRQR
jgi:GAF domain-containing protein